MKEILLCSLESKIIQQYSFLLAPLLRTHCTLKIPEMSDVIIPPQKISETIEQYTKRIAVLHARYTNCIAIAENSEYIVPALHVSETNVDAMSQLEIKEPSCIKRTVVVIANAVGNYKIIEHCLLGTLQFHQTASLLPAQKTLDSYFFITNLQKFEHDCSLQEYCHELDQLKVNLAEAILYYTRRE